MKRISKNQRCLCQQSKDLKSPCKFYSRPIQCTCKLEASVHVATWLMRFGKGGGELKDCHDKFGSPPPVHIFRNIWTPCFRNNIIWTPSACDQLGLYGRVCFQCLHGVQISRDSTKLKIVVYVSHLYGSCFRV